MLTSSLFNLCLLINPSPLSSYNPLSVNPLDIQLFFIVFSILNYPLLRFPTPSLFSKGSPMVLIILMKDIITNLH
ncbi:hypothetical protein F4805DRAFT_442074 [Annulohypoxylon moriforme]|nr:hypothetical protein F4805DRAFT_442074 [Annulohypoxylon moriforme]